MKKYIWKIAERFKKADVFSRKVSTVLYSSVFVCVCLISVAQLGLRSPGTRKFFTNIDEYEGGYFEASVNVSDVNEKRVFFFASGDGIGDARIYVNGEDAGALLEGENAVDVSGVEVVEIYSPKGSVTVTITDCSEDLAIYTPHREITVENGIKILFRAGIK